MTPEQVLSLTAELIRFRSLTDQEQEVIAYIADLFKSLKWKVERIPVQKNRENLFVCFGEPKIVFTTHVDVVRAPEELFIPQLEGGTLHGRGACDAKGIAATMIGVCDQLNKSKASGFGLLIVVGEEMDGDGAQSAAQALRGRGIKYLINGEPTEGKLMTAHKGGLGVTFRFSGRACHSGYPELGVDANKKLIDVAARLLAADFGKNAQLGESTINLGVISGGIQANIVSDKAELTALLRTVTPNKKVIEKLHELAPEADSIEITYNVDPVQLKTVPGFELDVAKYCSDIPFFGPLGAEALLYGPGSIHRAHTDAEFITLEEIREAMTGYMRLFTELAA